MTPRSFVSGLRRTVVSENLSTYRTLLESTDRTEATDEYWISVLSLYDQLNSSQRALLLSLIRQVIVDTLSTVLGIIDGTHTMESESGEVLLQSGSQILNGSLQDMFLEFEELGDRNEDG